MTQEEKQLLLKDLCARLPYRVRARFCDGVKEEVDDVWDIDMFSGAINADYIIDDVKPYLRPMSSMTDEEKKVLNSFALDMGNKWFDASSNEEKWLATTENNTKSTDYLYSKYLDIHGLIEKGLALEAPEGIYKTE